MTALDAGVHVDYVVRVNSSSTGSLLQRMLRC